MTEVEILRRAPGSGAILAACAALVAPLAVWLPLGLAPLFAVAALLVLVFERGALVAAARPLAPLALLLAALAAWASLSAAWSIVPEHSLLEGLRLFLVAAGGIVLLAATRILAPEERRRIALATLAGLGVALALLLAETATDGALTLLLLHKHASLSGFDRAATTAVLTFWPALLSGAAGRWYERALLCLAALATVFALASAGAALALVSGFVVFALARLAPRTVAAALFAGLVAIAVALPLATPQDRTVLALREDAPWIKWSGIHRLLIWRFAADRIAERPLLGWGMDASRALPGGEEHFAVLFPEAHLPTDAQALPLHPHNAALQWQVELGIPGSLPVGHCHARCAAAGARRRARLGRLGAGHRAPRLWGVAGVVARVALHHRRALRLGNPSA
jgi:exopolysaccharide production protein ExoQ